MTNAEIARQAAEEVAAERDALNALIAEKCRLNTIETAVNAGKAMRDLIEGKKFGDIEEIKDSTVLKAVAMWYDRVIGPVVQKVEQRRLNFNVEIDYSEFLKECRRTDRG